MAVQQATGKIKITLRQSLEMLGPYIWSKVLDQIKSVSLIVVYLILFQILILGIPVSGAVVVGIGIGVVIVGLAFFMEGLFLGLMPLGETCGVRLPQKTVLPVILVFAFMLGVGATFAEPAIGVLKTAGSSVKAWDAPLLFLILNKLSTYLVISVGIGVGIAVLFGMLRFMYNWSLKPFIYILYAVTCGISIWAFFEPNLIFVTGLAWDCGGVTTGPVTVPLVLALGIGISRVASKGGKGGAGGGFGVVTLASVFPIIAVMTLGIISLGIVPKPMNASVFFNKAHRGDASALFTSEDEMRGYCLKNAPYEAQLAMFDWDEGKLLEYVKRLGRDSSLRAAAFSGDDAFFSWLLEKGSEAERLAVYETRDALREAEANHAESVRLGFDWAEIFFRNGISAVQAILPLSAFLIFVLVVVLRERLKLADEIILGIFLAVIGMSLFSVGIELGLSRIGNQVGSKLPSSFKAIPVPEQAQGIENFDQSIVNKAITQEGKSEEFFYQKTAGSYVAVPFVAANYDANTGRYLHTPVRGPLFGIVGGIIMVIFFAFMMGYGATLAEPALNALGATVEELTVGTFRKSLLMQAVAIGVGVGIAFGVVKIVYDWPLIWMLVPPYAVLIFLTAVSSEEFVNIGWDSAGVTTGPVTVPLVLAMGLGVGGQVGVVEGFGILALASVWPILAVLSVGLYVTAKRRSALKEAAPAA